MSSITGQFIEFQPWMEVTMTTGGIIVAVWLVYRATSWFLHYRRVERTRQKIRQACQSRLDELSVRVNDRIAGQQPSVSNEFDRVTQLSLEQLLNDLRSRRVTAKTVLTAFQLKALSAHDRTNCLVEPIKEAEAWADELDSTSQTPTGALHGLPVSIKEYFGIKGYDGTLGLYKYLNKPAKEDSVLIKVLKAQGAIPFVKTNTPHAGLSYTARNPVYGITNNPVDSTRGAGGSSGGEAALLALNGSPLGFGSDLGGSIRNPSHFCGTYGLKPTSNRISKVGTLHWNQLSNCLPVSFGPMARDVDSLAIAMKAVLVPLMFQLDRSIPPMPFNNEIYTDSKPLRIGYYTNSGLFPPVQSCSRAVEIARDVLEKQGKHTLVPWSLPTEVKDLMDSMPILYSKIIVADEGKELLDMIEGDNPTDAMIPFVVTTSLPRFVRTILAHLLRLFDKQMGDNLGMLNGARNVAEWWRRVEEVQKVREVFDAAWEGAQLDAFVCPAFSCPALSRDLFMPIRGEGHDLMVFNMMDVPAGIVPVTVVTADDVNKTADYPDTYEIHRYIKRGMQGAEGLPIGVQVVAPRYQEELCLRVMKDIETGIKMKSK